jgi:hypothetical protein
MRDSRQPCALSARSLPGRERRPASSDLPAGLEVKKACGRSASDGVAAHRAETSTRGDRARSESRIHERPRRNGRCALQRLAHADERDRRPPAVVREPLEHLVATGTVQRLPASVATSSTRRNPSARAASSQSWRMRRPTPRRANRGCVYIARMRAASKPPTS